MERRTVLTGLLAASLCPICLARGAHAEGHAPHWNYEDGDEGPAHWGELAPEFKSCSLGTRQSPINLPQPVKGDLTELVINYQPFPLVVGNNGHSIRMNVPAGSSITYGGKKFNLINFHFHHPSEHTVDGQLYPMEAHLVHLSDAKDAAVVLGVFFVAGAENPALEPIWSAMTKEVAEVPTGKTYDLTTLLPPARERYSYEGSLTTPGCDEIVSWNVFRTPLTASKVQIASMADIFLNDARPVQPLNGRVVKSDF